MTSLKPFLRSVRDGLRNSLVYLGVLVVRCVPLSLWLAVRQKATVILPMDYPRTKIILTVDSWVEHEVRLHSCKKEPDTISWIENWFKPDDVLYDIGANVGAYSLVAFRFLQGRTKVYAFEPGAMTFPQLARNIFLNQATESIVPFQVALAATQGILTFHYQNFFSGGALHALGSPLDSTGEPFVPIGSLPVLCYRLDDFVEQFNLLLPMHIKIDVDGAELEILQGAPHVLRLPQLKTVLIEVDERHRAYSQILYLFTTAGFIVLGRYKENTLFVRSSQSF